MLKCTAGISGCSATASHSITSTAAFSNPQLVRDLQKALQQGRYDANWLLDINKSPDFPSNSQQEVSPDMQHMLVLSSACSTQAHCNAREGHQGIQGLKC